MDHLKLDTDRAYNTSRTVGNDAQELRDFRKRQPLGQDAGANVGSRMGRRRRRSVGHGLKSVLHCVTLHNTFIKVNGLIE